MHLFVTSLSHHLVESRPDERKINITTPPFSQAHVGFNSINLTETMQRRQYLISAPPKNATDPKKQPSFQSNIKQANHIVYPVWYKERYQNWCDAHSFCKFVSMHCYMTVFKYCAQMMQFFLFLESFGAHQYYSVNLVTAAHVPFWWCFMLIF